MIVFCLGFSFNQVNAAKIDLVVYVYEDESIFNYIITFNDTESYNKFSIEKPKDARIDYVVDQDGAIEYEIAGDYYIFKPDNPDTKTILLKYRSKLTSKEIYTTQAFKTYMNFNIPVEFFEFKVVLKSNFGEIISIFPGDYQLQPNNRISWTKTDLSSDEVFIINFKDETIIENTTNEIPFYYYVIIVILILLAIVNFLAFYLQYKKNKQIKEKGHEVTSVRPEIHKQPKTETSAHVEKSAKVEEPVDMFKEIVEKHLTENERDVVMIVKDNEGIVQHDILNHLPHLTKSNLSKIVAKLNSKKILKRIKVGKVNNIYLGSKISGNGNSSEVEKEEE